MENLTVEELMGAVGVILVVFAGIITVDKVMDIFLKWRKPSMNVSKKLEQDMRRLDSHDSAIQSLQESNKVLCNGVLAMLDHLLHNGNGEQMQEARDLIMQFLQDNMNKK